MTLFWMVKNSLEWERKGQQDEEYLDEYEEEWVTK
jgi:hypothetical protein